MGPPVNVFHRLTTMVIGDVGWVYLNLECSAILPTYPAKFANVLFRYLNIFAKQREGANTSTVQDQQMHCHN